ncbi:electron transport complex subunit RsxC [Ihubacter sp. mB4P-1]|uniref:electron transport complex subunit RsxC n=1 Tax=Ihubacter sp. mB4P-1 TaxID=3242370 RepID=UPI003C79E432
MNQNRAKKGVHPYEGKDLSKDSSIAVIPAAEVMVYPLAQHIGAPAKAVVSPKDRVLKGQMIAEADGFISSPIYSAVSGTVKAIEKRLVVNGEKTECIVIENDGVEETAEGYGKARSLDSLSGKEIIDVITKAGIVGLGGAGFPTGVKLSPKNPQDIDTLIINGAECEPYLTADYRLMLEKSDEILLGAKAVLKLFEKAKVVIGIEDNKPDVIRLFEEKTAAEEKISVEALKTKYPQGGERQLIYTVTGRKINSKMLPADKGCLVINAATCFAIYEAVYENKPLIHRIMTVTGEAANTPCNLDVPLGMSFEQVLAAAGGAGEDAVKYIAGGPMMGTAMATLDVPVVKASSAILVFSQDDVAVLSESACIHCGRCVGACPSNLIPQMLAKAVKVENYEEFERLGGMECMECGCCTYGCPAKIPLTQMFKLGKAKVREMRIVG